MCLRYRRRGRGVGTLLSNTTFSVLTNDFKILIKVATTPLLLPLSNVNNSCLFYINPYIAIHCGVAIKKTLPISIFLAVSTVNKVSYKLYRRGLSLVQLATEYASTRVPQSVLSLSKLY